MSKNQKKKWSWDADKIRIDGKMNYYQKYSYIDARASAKQHWRPRQLHRWVQVYSINDARFYIWLYEPSSANCISQMTPIACSYRICRAYSYIRLIVEAYIWSQPHDFAPVPQVKGLVALVACKAAVGSHSLPVFIDMSKLLYTILTGDATKYLEMRLNTFWISSKTFFIAGICKDWETSCLAFL